MPGDQHPARDPPALRVEYEGHEAIKCAGGRDIVQLHCLDERPGIEADDAEGQVAIDVGAEIHGGGKQDQLPARKRPAAALDSDLLPRFQPIADSAVADFHAGIDGRDLDGLARRGDHVDEVGEADFARQALHRAEGGGEIGIVGAERAGGGDVGTVPVDPPVPRHRRRDIGDDAERQRGDFVRLESRTKNQAGHVEVRMPFTAAKLMRDAGTGDGRAIARGGQRAGRRDAAIFQGQGKIGNSKRVEADGRLRIAHGHGGAEIERAVGEAPGTVALFDDQRNRADLPPCPAHSAAKAARRHRAVQAGGGQADGSVVRAKRQRGVGKGEAGLAKCDAGMIGGQAQRAVAAGADKRQIGDVRAAADALWTHGEQRAAIQRTKCLARLANGKGTIAGFDQRQGHAAAVDRQRAIGGKLPLDRQAKAAQATIGQRPIEAQRSRETGGAIGLGDEADPIDAQARVASGIGIDE